MSNKRKLVVFKSDAELQSRAASYPCLVNYSPFTMTGVYDDGVGHTADVTFAAATSTTDLRTIAGGPWDIIEISDAAAFSELLAVVKE
jgi:hypothetical protein